MAREGAGEEVVAKVVPRVVAGDVLPVAQHERGHFLVEHERPQLGAVVQFVQMGEDQVGGPTGCCCLQRRFKNFGVPSKAIVLFLTFLL